MYYFDTRYKAQRFNLSGIVRKIISGNRKGLYTNFSNHLTYEDWKRSKLVR